MAQSRRVNGRVKQIPPRADHVLRHVNDTVLNNLYADADETVISLPPIVSRALWLVHETSMLSVVDVRVD